MIAEEVADLMPDLVVYDADGQPETVKYHLLPAMLLNELQRRQQTIQELKSDLQKKDGELRLLLERVTRLEAALAGGQQ